MTKHLGRFGLFLLGTLSLAAACSTTTETLPGTGGMSTGECETASDCTSGGSACQQWSCTQHQCVAENAPAGSIPVETSVTVPPCHRLVCDGEGGTTVEVDTSVTPPQDGVAVCHRAACDATGAVVTNPDPTAAPPDTTPGDCQKPTCDANGNVTSSADPTDVPADETPGDCQKPSCDANGLVTSSPDPMDLPADVTGDCRLPACTATGTPSFTPNPSDLPPSIAGDCMIAGCDANGNITSTPDPNDLPTDTTPGDCQAPTCDASGNVVSMNANDPPQMTTCDTYTCQSGQAVAAPQNKGKSCSVDGFVCSATGTCDVCPPVDASCTDPGPGASAGSLASAYDLGTIGYCDEDGTPLCGAVKPGVTSYFGYVSNGSFSLCEFDPDVRVQASAPVTLCEYFDCASVTCPTGSLPATLGSGGLPGCCAVGAAVEMAITPACSDTQTYITVSSDGAACTTYELFFHS